MFNLTDQIIKEYDKLLSQLQIPVILSTPFRFNVSSSYEMELENIKERTAMQNGICSKGGQLGRSNGST